MTVGSRVHVVEGGGDESPSSQEDWLCALGSERVRYLACAARLSIAATTVTGHPSPEGALMDSRRPRGKTGVRSPLTQLGHLARNSADRMMCVPDRWFVQTVRALGEELDAQNNGRESAVHIVADLLDVPWK